MVNTEFPHYSLSKFNSSIDKYLTKVKSPTAVVKRIMKSDDERPGPLKSYLNYTDYIRDLFYYATKFHSFNCQESAALSALILQINGIKNVMFATIRNGLSGHNHAVCLFNRDGSKLPVKEKADDDEYKVKNNQTIMVDPWTGICDFANVALKSNHGFWDKHLKPDGAFSEKANGVYNIATAVNMDISDEYLDIIRKSYPNLLLKKMSLRKK